MSEAKNTALGAVASFRYAGVTPATDRPDTFTAMIATVLILAAFALLTAWDGAE